MNDIDIYLLRARVRELLREKIETMYYEDVKDSEYIKLGIEVVLDILEQVTGVSFQ